MEQSHVHGREEGSHRAQRTFPTWIRLSVIGVAAILVCAVVGGMFLY
jgi:hypothetical protein